MERYEKKNNWIDFNAGRIVDGEDMDEVADDLMDYVLEVASGKLTKSEINNQHGLAIWKSGVTL